MDLAANYELLDQIGAGGMAVVHRARQRGIAGFDRIVAVKQIHPHLAGRAEFAERFVREARIVSALAHPNIVQIYDFGGSYLAMEYLEGWSLLRIVSTASAAGLVVPLAVVLSLLHELCDALDHVHTRRGRDGEALGIVHRDLSLGNLFVARSGHLKLIDFGIATAPGIVSADDGRICGKPSYMAPEVIRGRASDARADVFAIGVLAWELLVGRRLFGGEDDTGTMREVVRAPAARVCEHRVDCPPMLDSLVQAALTKDPEKRTASAAIVRDQIEAVMRACEIDVRSSAVVRWLAESGLQAVLAAQDPRRLQAATASTVSHRLVPIASLVEPIAPPSREVRRGPTPIAWQLGSAPLPTLRRSISWRHALAVAAAIAIAPIAVAAHGHVTSEVAPAVAMTVTPVEPARPVPAPATPAPVAVHVPDVAVASAPPVAARAREVRGAHPSEPVHVPAAAPVTGTAPPGHPELPAPRVEPAHVTTPVAEASIGAVPMPAVVAVPAPIAVPRASSTPMTIAPNRVTQIAGAIGHVDRRRLERDGGPTNLSAVLCIDPKGKVTSVKLLQDVPAWLRETLVHDLGAFAFTPVPEGAACFVRQLAIR